MKSYASFEIYNLDSQKNVIHICSAKNTIIYHSIIKDKKRNAYTKSLVGAVFIGAFFICAHFQNFP